MHRGATLASMGSTPDDGPLGASWRLDLRGVLAAVSSGLYRLIKDHLAGGASRLAALLLPQILPVFSVVTPCQPGAALRDLVLVQPIQTTNCCGRQGVSSQRGADHGLDPVEGGLNCGHLRTEREAEVDQKPEDRPWRRLPGLTSKNSPGTTMTLCSRRREEAHAVVEGRGHLARLPQQ